MVRSPCCCEKPGMLSEKIRATTMANDTASDVISPVAGWRSASDVDTRGFLSVQKDGAGGRSDPDLRKPPDQKINFNPNWTARLPPEPMTGFAAATSGVAHPHPKGRTEGSLKPKPFCPP